MRQPPASSVLPVAYSTAWFASLFLPQRRRRRQIVVAISSMDQDKPARHNRRNAAPNASSSQAHQVNDVVDYLCDRFGEETVRNMDITPFDGCYFHSLVSYLYPWHWSEQNRRNHRQGTSTPVQSGSASHSGSAARAGSSSRASPRGNAPRHGGIRKRNTPRTAKNIAGGIDDIMKDNDNEDEDDGGDDDKVLVCDDDDGAVSNSGNSNDGRLPSPRAVVDAAAGAGGPEDEEGDKKNGKVLVKMEDLPKPILAGPRGKKKRATVRNSKVYFSPKPNPDNLDDLKGWVYCKVCGKDVWPPNNQKHLYTCFELE